MKRFLMYLIIVVVALFVGFTTYYAVQNKESIVSTIDNGSTITLNVGETYELPIEHIEPYKDTTIDENMTFSDQSIVTYNKETKTFLAEKAGLTTVVITPSNKNYGPFTYDFRVCDGTRENPLLIKTASQFKEMSTTTQTYYQLGNDIDLATVDNGLWTPISNFRGGLNGNGYTIRNLNIDSNLESVGLFANLEVTAQVENLVIENASVKSSGVYTGIIAGKSRGLVGKVQVYHSSIESTSSTGYVGGIVGVLEYEKSQTAKVQMCETFKLSIKANSNAGGLVGLSNAGVVLDSLASSVFSGEGNFAGIVNEVTSYKDASTEDIAVVKFSVAIIDSENVTNPIYAIVKSNTKTTTQSNAYVNNYYYSENTLSNPTGLTVTADTMKALTVSELRNADSYVNYNFDSVWKLDDGDATAHVMIEGYYAKVNVFSLSNDLTTPGEVKSALELLRTEGSNAEYTFNNDITVDFNGETWQMIPEFSGRIGSDNGSVLTLKNITVVGNSIASAAMFKVLNGSIENVNLENVTITDLEQDPENPSACYAAILAVRNNGLIQNVNVSGLNINYKGAFVSGLINVNEANGQIINCSVNKDYFDENVNLNSKASNAMVGGLVSYNKGLIKGSYVGTVVLTASKSSPSFAGIATLNEGEINACEVVGLEINYTTLGASSAGGISNNVTSTGSIVSSYANTVITLSVADSASKAGGLACYVASGAKVEKSASEGVMLAYSCAGLVNETFGNVEECYTNSGKLTGIIVSGLVNVAGEGSVTKNCYTLQTLEGYNDGSVVSGFVYDLRETSMVKYCFSAVSFTGNGDKFAESATEFRTPIAEKFWEYPRKWVNVLLEKINKRKTVGKLEDCAITSYGDAIIQYKSVVFKTTDDTFLSISADEFTQKTYQKKFTDHGFDITVWDKLSGVVIVEGEATASSYYPTLKNAYVIVTE